MQGPTQSPTLSPQRPSPERPAWLTRAAAIWRSDIMFRRGLMVLVGMLAVLLLQLRA